MINFLLELRHTLPFNGYVFDELSDVTYFILHLVSTSLLEEPECNFGFLGQQFWRDISDLIPMLFLEIEKIDYLLVCLLYTLIKLILREEVLEVTVDLQGFVFNERIKVG